MASSLANILTWKTWSKAIECSAEAACPAAEWAHPVSADVALHGLDGWLTLAFHPIAVGGQRCVATDSSKGDRCSYPFSSAPSTDVKVAEAVGRMRDEWGACHNIMSSYELRGRRGMSVGGGLDSAPRENTRPACCEMAPQRRPFEPELIDSLCHDADELLYFAVTHTERDHVTHSGGMLIMLSEEDG